MIRHAVCLFDGLALAACCSRQDRRTAARQMDATPFTCQSCLVSFGSVDFYAALCPLKASVRSTISQPASGRCVQAEAHWSPRIRPPSKPNQTAQERN